MLKYDTDPDGGKNLFSYSKIQTKKTIFKAKVNHSSKDTIDETALEFYQAVDFWRDISNTPLWAYWMVFSPLLPYFGLMQSLVKKLSDVLENNNLFNLSDTNAILKKIIGNDDTPFIYERLGSTIHNYLIDEFQDTSIMQWEILSPLLHESDGKGKDNLIIGDAKQSIYRFRGASLSAFDKVTNVQGIGAWAYYSLNRNYRTDKRLLDLFHLIFSDMGANRVLPYVENVDRLKSQLVKEYSDVDLIHKIDVHSKNKAGFYNDLFKEVNNQINELQKLSETKELSAEEKTIAILVRYNYQIANIVKAAERNENVDFTIKVTEGGDLYRLNSTTDLYKLILAITHPQNKVYLTNLIRSNYVSLNVNLAKISGYTQYTKTKELINLLDEYFMLHLGKSWNQLVTDFESRPVLVALRDIYEATKPWIHFRDEDLQREYRENYDCLIEKITHKYAREYMTINKVCDFLKINITTYQESASRNKGGESNEIQVICTTIHKSKGLEYGTIILPFTNEDISNIDVGGLSVNVIDGKVTYSLSLKGQGQDFSGGFDDKTEIKEKKCEESRILYVAMTRAIRNFVWLKDVDTYVDESWGSYMEVNG